MSTTTIDQPEQFTEVVVREPVDKLRPSWIARLRSADHKVIGGTLVGLAMIALVVAGICELLTWIQLAAPDNTFLTPERFLRLHLLSDTSYLYLVALSGVCGLGVYLVPLQIGARSTAFPRVSAFGCWSIVLGAVVLYASIFVNVPEIGPNLSVPLLDRFYMDAQGVDFILVAVMLFGVGLSMICVDLLTTIANMRAPGMSLDRTPIFTRAVKVLAFGMLVTAPVLVAACGMLLYERQVSSTGIFDPTSGGSAMLWQVLYQWFAYPAPLLVAIVAAGIVTEIVATFSGGKVAQRGPLTAALGGAGLIAVLGFGQVLFGAPIDGAWEIIFMVIGLAMAIPFATIVAGWLATMRGGKAGISVPMLYAIGVVVFFTSAFVDAIMLAVPPVGQWALGSEFGYAHWNFLVAGCGIFGVFAGLHYWYPKMTGRMYDEAQARLGFKLFFSGLLVDLLMLASLGIDGFPREIQEYHSGQGYQLRLIIVLVAAIIAAVGAVIALVNFGRSATKGDLAGNDPWAGATLEWYAQSPPPVNNFDVIPEVGSDTPLTDLRERIAQRTGGLAGSVAQPPTYGRPALRESHD